MADQNLQEVSDVLSSALTGFSGKSCPVLKSQEEAVRSETPEDSGSLAQLQHEALSDVERQLADLQQRRALKRARKDGSTSERPRCVSLPAPYLQVSQHFDDNFYLARTWSSTFLRS